MKRLLVLFIVGCQSKPTPDASASASASAFASASASPSASAPTWLTSPSTDSGIDPGLSPTHSPVASAKSGALRGLCKIDEPKTTVPIPDAEKTLNALLPRYRLAYEKGLEFDPQVKGTVDLTAQVSATGEVPVVTAAGTITMDRIRAGIASATKGARFTAPGKPSVLTFRVICKRADE